MSQVDHGLVRVTAIGVGLIAFMTGWLVFNRISEQLVAQPRAAWLAMTGAVVCGVLTAVMTARRLRRGGSVD